MPPVEWAGDLFRRIAVPRPPGSQALSEVAHVVAGRLTALGYTVRRDEFQASSRGLKAVALAGAGLGGVAVAVMPLLVIPVAGWPVAVVGLAALALVALLAWGMAVGQLPPRPRSVHAANLVATKGEPKLWLVAHADSKGQSLSLRGRVAAVIATGVGATGLLLLLVLRLLGPLPWWTVLPVGLLALVGGAALSRDPLAGASPGAVDNATGVVAALVAADRLSRRDDVGVLITDAEEFGMQGARFWVAHRVVTGLFINFDGLDVRGRYRVMRHRGPAAAGERAGPLAHALVSALAASGNRVERRQLPPGVLVDGVALGASGMAGVTVSRGDWSTLGVVHTPRDTVERTDVSAAVAAGVAAAQAAVRMLG